MSARLKQLPVDEDDHPVTRAIDQMGAFMLSAIETPGLLDFFPDSGEIGFCEIDIHGHEFQLAAVGPENAEAAGDREWEARPSRYVLKPGALAFQRPIPRVDFDPNDQIERTLAVAGSFSATGSTKQGALDALEAKLRSAIEEAVRVDPNRKPHRHG